MEAKENFQEQAEATKNEARTKPARKPTNSTSKLAGSLFAPVLLDEPRRRNTFSMPDSTPSVPPRTTLNCWR